MLSEYLRERVILPRVASWVDFTRSGFALGLKDGDGILRTRLSWAMATASADTCVGQLSCSLVHGRLHQLRASLFPQESWHGYAWPSTRVVKRTGIYLPFCEAFTKMGKASQWPSRRPLVCDSKPQTALNPTVSYSIFSLLPVLLIKQKESLSANMSLTWCQHDL